MGVKAAKSVLLLAALSHHGDTNESILFVGILNDVSVDSLLYLDMILSIYKSLNSCLSHAHTCKHKTLRDIL